MKNYEFTPDGYMKKLCEAGPDPFSNAGTPREAAAVSAEIRTKLREILGVDRMPCAAVDLKVEKIKTVKRKGYSVETLKADILEGFSMLCYVLIPEEKTEKDAVVCLCGHGYGARQIIRQSKSGKYRTINFIDNYQKNFGEALALDGHMVICPEFFGFGESRLKCDIHKPFYISSCDTLSHQILLSGISVASVRVFQAMKCIDILDREYGCTSFGCMGISGGGLVALYTACTDERIKKVCVCGYINSFEKSVLSRWHCPDNYIPGLMTIGEMSDFASSLAPRKLMMQYGTGDKLFPVDASRNASEKIKMIYDKSGVSENFFPVEFEGRHEVYLPGALDFFRTE